MNTKSALTALKNVDLKGLKKKQAAYEESFMNIPQTDPWIPIEFLDRKAKANVSFRLEYSYEAAQLIQRQFDKNIFAGELTVNDLSDMATLMGVLVIGLQTHHEGMTLETLGPLVTLKHRMYYVHCIIKAMEVTQPDYDQLEAVLGDIQELSAQVNRLESGDLEAGDTTAPLPEIVPYPTFGEVVEP